MRQKFIIFAMSFKKSMGISSHNGNNLKAELSVSSRFIYNQNNI